MDGARDVGHGRLAAGLHDRLLAEDGYAGLAAVQLAQRHPGGGLPALEFGVGTGLVAIPLAERVGTVVGVDSSPEALERLRRDAGEANAAVTAVHGDIRTWRDRETYGLVYCVRAALSAVLDPDDQAQVVRRAAERLAPGGTLVVETWNRRGVLELFEGEDLTSGAVAYPGPRTGLITYSRLLRETWLWHASHLRFQGDSFRVSTEVARLTTPDEMDEFAVDAGLTPRERLSDWSGTPWTETSALFVSSYVAEQ